jgi:hypothetical protein
MQCHTIAAGFALGPETAQLNKDFTYPSTSITASQLATLDHIVAFASPLPATPNSLPSMPDPTNSSASLNDLAHAYLHTHCAQCHQASGPTPVDLDLRRRWQIPTPAMLRHRPKTSGLQISGVSRREMRPDLFWLREQTPETVMACHR